LTFHHKHRVEAHTAHLKLKATELNTARTLADCLNDKTGTIQLSARYLSTLTGHTEKTTQAALRTLIDLGIFTATRPRQRRARTYSLALCCPDNCLKLGSHNTRAELIKISASKRATQSLTGNSEILTGKNNLTNRTKEIDDIGIENLRQVIQVILEQIETLTPGQTKLSNWLISDPGAIEARALQLIDKHNPRDIKPWLTAIIDRNPETIYRHLELNKKTPRQVINEKRQASTIYSEHSGTSRLTRERFDRYALEIAGFKITKTSWNYLSKCGAKTTWRDLEIAKQLELIAGQSYVENLNPGSSLILDLVENQISISYDNPEATGFDLACLELMNLATAGELSEHLEAERLEAQVRADLEAAGKSWKTDPDYWILIADIRANYNRITPQEAARRYTQTLMELISNYYKALPEQPDQGAIEPLEAWLNRNYTQLHDYQDFLAAYPPKPEAHSWNEAAGFTAYLEKLGQGFKHDHLEARARSYAQALGTGYPQHPQTWLNALELSKPKQAQEAPGSPQLAGYLSELASSFTKL